jgi:alkanesulfonate monooxygenase SsuD/methylene tetrahydromethanopterin reductase-like flavin-dependent oxidoreductase (luciferase family)
VGQPETKAEEPVTARPSGKRLRFGVNVNNREPLIAPGYDIPALLDLSHLVEEAGFDSVWVGDSLFSKPRYEPLALLSAISQRTRRVKLGTACLVTATRNPLYLALEWATLDVISGGRTILGACMGNPEIGVRREYAALGLDFGRRASIFEEGLEVLRQLFTGGSVTFRGHYFNYENVSFHSGTEMAPLMPIQKPPPIWIVSNPRLVIGKKDEARATRIVDTASHRIVKYGDGWMTCCRARHPEEFVEQYECIEAAAEADGQDIGRFTMSYQVTMNIGDSQEGANRGMDEYISQYYPELGEWGPVGTPDTIAQWIQEFADAGVDTFICRFGSLDQFGQVKRFAREVLPRFAPTGH